MTRRFPTLQTVMHYSIARVRVLVTSRTTWAVLMAGCALFLAVMGTSAAWRARTGGVEDDTRTLVDHTPVKVSTTSEVLSDTHPEALDVPTASSSPVHATPTATPAGFPDTRRNSVSATASGEEHAQCDAEQGLRAAQPRFALVQPEMHIAEPHQERVRVRKEMLPFSHSPRTQRIAVPLPVPAVAVVSVSSTAALIQRGHWRQVIHRGARLNGWTVTRLTPTGLMLQHGRRQAMLPLSFAVRTVSAR